MLSLSDLLAAFPGLDQFAVAFGVDGMVVSQQSIAWGDISDSTVESHVVVMRDIVGDDSSSILQGQGRLDADAFALQRFVPTFDLAVGLRIVRRGPHVGHASNANELFEILGDELRSIVGDDATSDIGMTLARTRQDGFHVDFLHFFADFPVDDRSVEAIKDGAEKVESAGDVEISDIDIGESVNWDKLLPDQPIERGGNSADVFVDIGPTPSEVGSPLRRLPSLLV